MQTSYQYLRSGTSAVLTLALLAAPFSVASAAANEITTVSFAAERALNTNVNTSFTVTVPDTTPDSTLAVGDQIIVRIPDAMQITGTPTGLTDFTMTSNGTLSGGTYGYDATAREISYTLDADDAVTEGQTLTVTFLDTAAIKTPVNSDANSGQYAFSARLVSSATEVVEADRDMVLASGIALLAVNNTLDVVATVQEALVLTVSDTSLNLNVDPSVNGGEDYTQKTVLTVATNANSGYKIQGKLDNGAGAAGLRNAATGDTIAAGDAEATENKFSYIAYNGDGAATPDITGTVTRTQTEVKSDVNGMSAFGTADANLTNVPATASNAAPTAAGLGYSDVANVSKHTVYYGLNVDYTMPAGTYTGTITYTAVPTF